MKKPLFIQVEKYEDVRATMQTLRKRMQETRSTLDKVKELKQLEDEKLAAWEDTLRSVSERMQNIDQTLGEPEQL